MVSMEAPAIQAQLVRWAILVPLGYREQLERQATRVQPELQVPRDSTAWKDPLAHKASLAQPERRARRAQLELARRELQGQLELTALMVVLVLRAQPARRALLALRVSAPQVRLAHLGRRDLTVSRVPRVIRDLRVQPVWATLVILAPLARPDRKV